MVDGHDPTMLQIDGKPKCKSCIARTVQITRKKKVMKHTIDDNGPTAVLDRPEAKSGSGKSDAEKQEMQKKMEAAGTPGPAHKIGRAHV